VLLAVGLGAVVAAVLAPGVRGAMGRLLPTAMPPVAGILGGIAAVVLGFALLTAALAARRISGIDPQEALRE
jgi:ABC-type antimicrobial peptide transport system permease subunit